MVIHIPPTSCLHLPSLPVHSSHTVITAAGTGSRPPSPQRFCRNRLTSTLSPALLPEQAHVHPLPSASAGTGSRPPSPQRFCRNRLTSTLSPALLPEQAHVHPLPSASAGTGSLPPSPSFQTFSHLNHVIPMAATQRAANILMKRFCLQTDQEGNSKYNKKITKLV